MFDTSNLQALSTLTDADLATLPSSEDEAFEFKSSATPDQPLATKLQKAASGFWNSGGGFFIAGVDGSGRPDGGIANTVGRQSRRDWVDQVIATVDPRGSYGVATIGSTSGGLNIAQGNVVLVVGFAPSYSGPHMAPDGRYYTRTGAHTEPARHFIVEAIRARRGLAEPMLRHVLRINPARASLVELGLIALNDAPALDVELNFDPLPPLLAKVEPGRFPLRIGVIERNTPFFLNVALAHEATLMLPDGQITLRARYSSIVRVQQEYSHLLMPSREVGPLLVGESPLEKIAKAIEGFVKKQSKPATRS
jgi:hypothetical protein